MKDPRYPIGPFRPAEEYTPELRAELIQAIAETPERLREALAGLSEEQLDEPYRAGGWTLRQVVHHLADSHLNAYVRFKLAATENEPVIKPYAEARWAELPDAAHGDPAVSLALLKALHERWVAFLESLPAEQFSRAYRHPEQGLVPLDRALALYAWHGRHHVAHITAWRASQSTTAE